MSANVTERRANILVLVLSLVSKWDLRLFAVICNSSQVTHLCTKSNEFWTHLRGSLDDRVTSCVTNSGGPGLQTLVHQVGWFTGRIEESPCMIVRSSCRLSHENRDRLEGCGSCSPAWEKLRHPLVKQAHSTASVRYPARDFRHLPSSWLNSIKWDMIHNRKAGCP